MKLIGIGLTKVTTGFLFKFMLVVDGSDRTHLGPIVSKIIWALLCIT